ncbi:MAG: hypothetical protein AB7Q81_12860 [Gammaproteobacteria bacterium]
MQYFPYSAVAIPKAGRIIARDAGSLNAFWEEVNKEEEGLSEAIGCYIFSIRAGKGLLPWYVGLAEKQTFRKECFAPHKLNHYNDAIANRKGTPTLTLIPKFTEGDRFAKPSKNGHRDIQLLETMLIGACLRRNKGLLNAKDTKLLREMVVPGLLNNQQGRDYQCVREFRALIGS